MKVEHDIVGLLDHATGEIVYSMVRHRVGECPYCDMLRARRIAREFLRRLDQSGLEAGGLHLWSLGCSLKDSAYNRKILGRWWRKFTEAMKRSGWCPCFRIMEAGKRGFLHYHVVVSGFVPHALVLEKWRRITGEKSNVNVSPFVGDEDHLAGYLTKYVTKGAGDGSGCAFPYSWLGPFRTGPPEKPVKGPSRDLEYLGYTVYHGPTVNGYKEPLRQKKLQI